MAGPPRKAREGLATYCFSAGGFTSGVGAGSAGSAVGVVRSSGAAAQSPAQILVPLTDPKSLQPIGAGGLTTFSRLVPTLGAAV
jgi:hypothetical protein